MGLNCRRSFQIEMEPWGGRRVCESDCRLLLFLQGRWRTFSKGSSRSGQSRREESGFCTRVRHPPRDALHLSGGAVREIHTPLIGASPVDVSVDGKRLLLLAREGYEKERPLWILTVGSGDLRQVGTLKCHAAAWSPDEHAIAFASHSAVYLTGDQGKTVHPLQVFGGIPEAIGWSKDGSRLRVELHDYNSATFSFWDLSLEGTGKNQIAALIHLKTDLPEFFNASMATDQNDRLFLVGGDIVSPGMLTLGKNGGILHRHYSLQDLNVPLAGATRLALDWRNRRIFALGSAAVQRMPRKEGDHCGIEALAAKP